MSENSAILRLHINITHTQEVASPSGLVRMILFDGNCDSPYFQGTILPAGVDTQTFCANDQMTLSARYMLEGLDSKGQKCKLFIENNAASSTGEFHVTTPRIFTDSPSLQWLETADLYGQLLDEDGKLVIEIRERGKSLKQRGSE